MNQHKEELQFLKEVQLIHTVPVKRTAYYKRLSLIFRVVGIILFGVAYFLSRNNTVGSLETLLISLFGGILLGLGFFLLSAANQVPWMNQFTSPNVDLIDERIRELENSSPNKK